MDLKPVFIFFNQLSDESLLVQAMKTKLSSRVLLSKNFFLLSAESFANHFRDKFVIKQSDLTISQFEERNDRPQRITLIPSVFAFHSRQALEEFMAQLVKQEHTFQFKGETIRVLNGQQAADFSFEAFEKSACSLNAASAEFDFTAVCTPPRSFNSVEIGKERVNKICQDVLKGEREWTFLNSLPSDVQHFYPKVYDGIVSGSGFQYSLEKKPMFDLGCLSLHQALDESDWQTFFELLSSYFETVPTLSATAEEYRRSLKFLCIDKLISRVELFQRSPTATDSIDQFRKTVGSAFEQRIEHLIDQLTEMISSLDKNTLTFTHGDLCFSNILFDPRESKICLIDPRGSFVSEAPYAPIEYDLAKLSHSLRGGYDWILAGRPFPRQYMHSGEVRFENFLEQFKVDPALIRLIEASLFWSMLPLHMDEGERILSYMMAGETAFQEAHLCR